MSFFYSLIVILESFLTQDWMNYYFFPFIGLAFLAAVPRLIKSIFAWR